MISPFPSIDDKLYITEMLKVIADSHRSMKKNNTLLIAFITSLHDTAREEIDFHCGA